MSGIYIKGLEMPEFGEKIIILTSSGYVEDVSGQVIQGIEAIPVPDHDDLIDRTTVKDYWLYADWDTCMDLGKEKNAFAVINSVSAIIPADKEVDNG